MDYIDFHVCRIADNLRRASVSIPGNIPAPAVTDEPQQEIDFTIARGHKSTVYLPHWIRDHRDDPALTVSPFIVMICSEGPRTLWQPGLHGSLTHPPP